MNQILGSQALATFQNRAVRQQLPHVIRKITMAIKKLTIHYSTTITYGGEKEKRTREINIGDSTNCVFKIGPISGGSFKAVSLDLFEKRLGFKPEKIKLKFWTVVIDANDQIIETHETYSTDANGVLPVPEMPA